MVEGLWTRGVGGRGWVGMGRTHVFLSVVVAMGRSSWLWPLLHIPS